MLHHKNDFIHVSRHDTDNHKPGLQIECSSCDATQVVTLSNAQGPQNSMEQDLAEKLFKNRGWRVGRKRGRDICPTCQSHNTPKEEHMPSEPVKLGPTNVIDLAPNITIPAQALRTGVTGEPLPQPSREEKRIIWSKLEETFLDEKSGYSAGWSDQRIAQDLGVPRAWVAKIRDENFGADNTNEEMLKLAAELGGFLERIEKEREKVLMEARNLTKLAGVMAEDSERLKRRMAAIEKGFR